VPIEEVTNYLLSLDGRGFPAKNKVSMYCWFMEGRCPLGLLWYAAPRSEPVQAPKILMKDIAVPPGQHHLHCLSHIQEL
jgi:hypothetical protein